MTRQKWGGHIAILITNIIFGLNTPITKTLLPEWISPLGLTIVRMGFGAAAFWTLSLFTKNEKVPGKDMIILFLGALFGMIGNQLSFVTGLSHTSPVDASMITANVPVMVMLIAALVLKEPITGKKAIGVLLGASGAMLIIWQSASGYSGKEGNLVGNMFCFISVVSYSIYLVMTRPISQRYGPITLMKWMFLFATVLSVPFSFQDVAEAKIFSGEANMNILMRFGFILIFATVITYMLIPMALKRIRPTTVSMYNNIQPIVTSIVAIAIGQDTLTWDKPVATLLVFTGVYLVTQSKSREDVENEMKRRNAVE